MRSRVLLIVSMVPQDPENSFNWRKLKEWTSELLGNKVHVEVTALSELVFFVGTHMAVYDPAQGFDIADFDLVIFRTVGQEVERGIAAAHYLQHKQVPFVDKYLLTQGKGKLACSVPRVAMGLSVPQTIYARADLMKKVLQDDRPLSFPFVLKADRGKKGNNNFLIKTDAQLAQKLRHMNQAGVDMVAQEFIPNDGDYRVLVLGGRPRLAILRKGAGDTHLNNTSQGGSAQLVSLEELPPKILDDCVAAAQQERLQVAGVDVVIDSRNGKHYFLEVNRAPQLPTGAFAEEKMQVFADMIEEYLQSTTKPLPIVGRVEKVDLPELGLESIPAKIDTGADVSSVWASKVELKSDGLHCVFFGKDSPHFTGRVHVFPKSTFTLTRIANSFGDKTIRYKVKLSFRLQGRLIRGTFTLSDRSQKVYPILIGRRSLKGKFLVDVSQGDALHAIERARAAQLEAELSQIRKRLG